MTAQNRLKTNDGKLAALRKKLKTQQALTPRDATVLLDELIDLKKIIREQFRKEKYWAGTFPSTPNIP